MSNMFLSEQQNYQQNEIYQRIVTYSFIIMVVIFCSFCSMNFNILVVLS
jgi:hypothetical protein